MTDEDEAEAVKAAPALRAAIVCGVAILCLVFVYVALPILWLYPLQKLGSAGVMSEDSIDNFSRPLRQFYMRSASYRRYIDAQYALLDRFSP